MALKSYASLLKEAAANWSKDAAPRLGAALAYYSVFSLGPMLLIAIAVAGLVFGEEAVTGEVMRQLKGVMGEQGAGVVQNMLAGARKPAAGGIAAATGVIALLFAATGVVIQLKAALNLLWNVEPTKTKGVWGFVRNYVISVAAVLGIGFLLMVSFLLTTALAATGEYLRHLLPLPEIVLQLMSIVGSFAVVMLLFAMMFKWLPDTEIQYRDVWLGAAVTALLFTIGKTVIGLYIGKQSFDSTYGAAGSFVAMLIWIYYSAQILFFGAAFSEAYSRKFGSRQGAAAPGKAEARDRAREVPSGALPSRG